MQVTRISLMALLITYSTLCAFDGKPPRVPLHATPIVSPRKAATSGASAVPAGSPGMPPGFSPVVTPGAAGVPAGMPPLALSPSAAPCIYSALYDVEYGTRGCIFSVQKIAFTEPLPESLWPPSAIMPTTENLHKVGSEWAAGDVCSNVKEAARLVIKKYPNMSRHPTQLRHILLYELFYALRAENDISPDLVALFAAVLMNFAEEDKK